MKKTTKISIIIPVFNANKYLEETINSVKYQTFINWECILINDGSIDNSESVIIENIKEDKRFRYIFQENTGVCVARNNAIIKSKGEYVLCLDADDLISENFLEETLKVLESDSNIKVATSAVQYFGRSKGALEVVSYDLNTILAANQIVVTSLFRRVDFDWVGGFNENMKEGFEDWDFWISILKSGGNVKCASSAVFYYRIVRKSRNSEMANANMAKLRFQMWQNHRDLFSLFFVSPTSYFEYQSIAQSKEYRLGKMLLAPIRKLLGK